MAGYLVKRLLATIPVVVTVAIFVFSLLYFAPGDPALLIAGDHATAEEVDRVRSSLGLDQPFLVRFGTWSWQILHGDLGRSVLTNVTVSQLIAQRIEPTISLMLVTLTITVIIAVPLGAVAAWNRGSLLDAAVMSLAVAGFSIPAFVLGYALAYTFGVSLRWLPVQGYSPLSNGVGGWFVSLLLPSLALGGSYIALVARLTRASMLEVLQQDFIRTARAKGVHASKIIFLHALKAASIPIATVIGLGIASLVGGAVVTESVFAIPGLGRLTIDAIVRRDYPVIQGIVLLFSFIYVFVNLLIDLLYVTLDPRIEY